MERTHESLGLNIIEMDWRQYDPAIGFNVVDPMAEGVTGLLLTILFKIIRF